MDDKKIVLGIAVAALIYSLIKKKKPERRARVIVGQLSEPQWDYS